MDQAIRWLKSLQEMVNLPSLCSYWFGQPLFFGSALTIMNFHADVNMQEVQIRIVEMLTGHRDEHPYLFQVAYSIGIGFGMAVFFNHLFKKKWNEEPTPLEVEMFLYQQNVDKYVVIEESERMHEQERREMNADERS